MSARVRHIARAALSEGQAPEPVAQETVGDLMRAAGLDPNDRAARAIFRHGYRAGYCYAERDTPAAGMDAARAKAIEDVQAERQRQIAVEGWTAEHDDSHRTGHMALAAACYAAPARIFVAEQVVGRAYEPFTLYRDAWPWADRWWKPKDRRADLVRAGALILAEIERIDRLATKGAGS